MVNFKNETIQLKEEILQCCYCIPIVFQGQNHVKESFEYYGDEQYAFRLYGIASDDNKLRLNNTKLYESHQRNSFRFPNQQDCFYTIIIPPKKIVII